MERRQPAITQFRLARIQELQADAMRLDEDATRLGKLMRDDQRELRKERTLLRKDILRGAMVEPGPLQAFVRKVGRGKKRRVIVVVK